jgi:hypothetical protein
VPDLLVANSGSNNVWLEPGLGNGFFDDQTPIIYPVGTGPTALFVGNFKGGSGQDLVTVNSGSDNVTLISGLSSGSPVIESTSSGGVDPIAAFEVDVTGSGQDSLVVANNGDGNIALLSGGENGLVLSSVLSSSGIPNPCGLALAGFVGGNLEFYATNDGEEAASLLGFQLEEGGAVSALSSTGLLGGSAQLLSLNETSLALVGTLLTLTISLQTENEQTSEGSTAQAAAAVPGSAGQSLLGNTPSLDGPEALGETSGQSVAKGENPQSWARFVIGVDQAIEKLRSEADQRFLEEQQPPRAKQPGTTRLEQKDGAHQTGPAAPLETAVSGVTRRSEAQRGQWEAIDTAIGDWGGPKDASGLSPLSVTRGTTVPKSPSGVAELVERIGGATRLPGPHHDSGERIEIQVSSAATLVVVSASAGWVRESRRSKRLVITR